MIVLPLNSKIKMKNRVKRRESTLCQYTECGKEIKEGDILGYGDNYPCVVLYNKYEAKFEAIEFGYKEEGSLYRVHDIISYTTKWKILGNVDENFSLLKQAPVDFDYNKDIKQYY